MEMSLIEKKFQKLDNLVELIEKEKEITYMDALVLGLEYIHTGELPTGISESSTDIIKELVQEVTFDELEKEQVRKVLEFAMLKSMKGSTQQQHLLTPDTVAMYIAYLAEKLIGEKKQLRMFDPTSGTANLLTAVFNQLNREGKVYGSEIDPTLIQLAVLSANLQKTEIEYFHQDSIQPLLLDPVDLVVADLPVGYYPDDIRASQFDVHVKNDHTYAHHLLIEQSVHYVKPGGYLLFVIPNSLFDSDQATKLHGYIQANVHVVGLLQLPISIFRSDQQAKSIFVLQKKGEHTKAPKQALMAKLPSFKDSRATENIVAKMNEWFKNEGY